MEPQQINQAKSLLDNLTQSIRRSVTIKLISIFVLMMLLLIPMAFVKELIRERDNLHNSAIREVSDKWANKQHVYGPVLTIPFKRTVVSEDEIKKIRDEAHVLPSTLLIDGEVDPQSLHRGIYEVVVYDSKLRFSGQFEALNAYFKDRSEYEPLWDEAFLTINISDLRGIKEKVVVEWNGTLKNVDPGSGIPGIIKSGITVNDIFEEAPGNDSKNFAFDMHLQGSQFLGFIPMGKETNVRLKSDWADPSFSGSFLPDNRDVSEAGFTADYKILELNRNYPQFWTGTRHTESIDKSVFGVELLLPMNDYQKSMRSAKYALLAISLTFLTFFLVEVFSKKEVHPFQYVLIGLALCLFYTLLVSISEHSNFNMAYIISSISVIAMIGLYARAIIHDLKQSLLLVLILILTYTFVFITLQVQDYALLIGSVGLTSILALTMYITRNINWYELNEPDKTEANLSV